MPNKSKIFSIPIFALITALLASPVFATIIRVPQDQPTIQAGINAAVSGDTVLVAAGTYNENIDFNGRSIVLLSESGPELTGIFPATTLPIIKLVSGEDSTTIVEGFKLFNGNTANGGAIRFIGSKGTVRNNIFEFNQGEPAPSINCENSSIVRILNNIFRSNTGTAGAVLCRGSRVEVRQNLIINNNGLASVLPLENSQASVLNNTFVNNTSAMSCQSSSTVDIRNNIFVNNPNYGIHSDNSNVVINYNDFINSPLSGPSLGIGNIELDPLFVGGNPFDYHLQQGSPCIDAGDPAMAVPPGGGLRIDMGAFEFLYGPSFFLVAPLPNEELRIRQPTLIWSQLHNPEGAIPSIYQAILDDNVAFSTADSSAPSVDTTWKVPFKLFVGQTYYWKVVAVSDSGDTVISPVRSFTALAPPFALFLPTDNQQVNFRQPTFVWQKVQDSSTIDSFFYWTILAKDSSFSIADTSISGFSDTTWKVPYKLDLNQNYFWKVLTINQYGESFLSEEVRTFTVNPPQLSLQNPLNGERVLTKQPTFVWRSVNDTSIPDNFTYQVIYANNPSFSSPIFSPVIFDTFWQVSTPLAIATTYYWKVLTFYSAANDTLQSGARSFLLAPTTIYVSLDKTTIQEAIDIAFNGDTISVEPGIYQQNIFFNAKRIKLLSESGPESTTIAKLVDGAPLVSFSGSEDSNTVLRGFTLKGARLVPNGAAINVASASPIIEDNVIQDNQGDSAVIYVQGGSPKIRRNLIAGNNTSLAAIGFFGGAGGQIINNTIANNTGDGIRIAPAMAMQIKNNILASNSGYGIRSVGGINNTSTVSYNDNYSNTLGTYFSTIPTSGEIYQNPQFRAGSPFDYHLALGSPCIDAGDPASPVPPGGGARVDIGAFEFVPTLGDLNGDGLFTPADVVLELNCVFSETGNCPFSLADMNCDSQLSPADVVLILSFVFSGSPLPC